MKKIKSNDAKIRFSKYVHQIGIGNVVHLINLLTRSVISVDLMISTQIALYVEKNGDHSFIQIEDSDELLKALYQGLFIVDESFSERDYITGRFAQDRSQTQTYSMIISPTVGCNLDCHYCFESKSNLTIDDHTAKEIVEFAGRQLLEYGCLHVQWFGGEPLTRIPTIKAISQNLIQLCNSIGKEYSSEIITNGTRLDRATAISLRDNGIKRAQVTFEGDRDLHDRVRRSKTEPKTFERILSNIFDASDVLDFAIRIHVTPYNVDSLFDLIARLGNLNIGRHVDKVYFAPLFNFKQSNPLNKFQSMPTRYLTVESYAKIQSELLFEAKRRGLPIPDFLDANYGLCSAASTSTIVVNPDGTITKCYLDTGDASEAIGSVASGPHKDSSNKAKWDRYSIFDDEECAACSFLPLCMGGCPKQKMADAPKSQICTPLKFNIKDRTALQFGNLT